ncbi:MutS-related protein [Nocardia macrotermitis]|uniref:DNA mismatch repair protein MutS n=1 Tax=Nocardia macrotermitis TaxID=2585198 RepID=A0A7K0D978_9NOCA|nr:DNA mismatch repair protein [Nocardia macrotermitis]MQY21872.1 DNA mismatch repair protein MutS [Nocardia macrotermitis]
MRLALLQPPDVAVRTVTTEPRTLTDLGLDALCTAMSRDEEFGEDPAVAAAVRAILPVSVTDPEVIRYRHAVLADCCAHPDAVRELYRIATRATQIKRYRVGPRHRPNGKLLLALEPLRELLGCLRELRTACARHTASFESAGFADLAATVAAELDESYLTSVEQQLATLDFEHGLHFTASLGPGDKIAGITLHAPIRRRRFGLDRRTGRAFEAIDDPEPESDPLVRLQNPALQIIADVVSDAADHVQDFFGLLHTQLAFYLGCVTLHRRLIRDSIPFCLPTVHPTGSARLRCTGLRDIGLCLTAGRTVVGNDLDATGRTLVIVTGANNGGKSTFLRSVGAAQLMAHAGIFVTATTFETDLHGGIFTHFAADEDRTMSHGKLVEELTRMSTLIDHMTPNSLLLCNESFATTAARDAEQIATPLLNALLDTGITILFVTHLTEFARRRADSPHPTDLFLRAERLPDGTRTYHLTPATPEPESHATDIFHKVFDRTPESHTPPR